MITLDQNKQAKKQYAGFIQQCQEFKDLLTSMNLPYSIDVEAHKQTFRLRIADELLKADAGLKMRWDILRTEEGRQKLRKETAATIDLAGYEDVEQLEQGLERLRKEHKLIQRLPDQTRWEFRELAGQYKLDLAAAIDSRTMVWDEDGEKVLDYFRQVAQQLHQLQSVVASIGRPAGRLDVALDSIFSLYKPAERGAAMVPDEQEIYTWVLPKLRGQNLLADFPAGVK